MIAIKRICSLFLILFVTLAFHAQAATPPEGTFPKTLKFGNDEWTLGNSEEDDNLQLAEYVTGTETVNKWTQLVTFQNFKFQLREGATPKMFADGEMAHLKEQIPSAIFTILESSDKEAIVEFKISKPETDQQDELQRIIKTPDNRLVVLHYVITKPDMGTDARKVWIANLKSVNLPFMSKTFGATAAPAPATTR